MSILEADVLDQFPDGRSKLYFAIILWMFNYAVSSEYLGSRTFVFLSLSVIFFLPKSTDYSLNILILIFQ